MVYFINELLWKEDVIFENTTFLFQHYFAKYDH